MGKNRKVGSGEGRPAWVSTCGSVGANWAPRRGLVLAWTGTQTYTEARSEDAAVIILTVNLHCTPTTCQVLL